MTELHIAALVAHDSPFISQAQAAWECFSSSIIIHTDEGEGSWHERENEERSALWSKVCKATPVGDMVLILDDDMVPARDPRDLIHPHVDAVAFAHYDLWGYDPLTYRHDHMWTAHMRPRVWAVKMYPDMHLHTYPDRSIHCGHLPRQLPLANVIVAPDEYSLLHHAYASPQLRESKHEQYGERHSDLTADEREHVASIIDDDPNTHLLHIGEEWPLRF